MTAWRPPTWHRLVYLAAAVPLSLFALMGSEYGAAPIYGIPGMGCIALAARPVRAAAAVLFWVFLVGAIVYAFVLIGDLFALTAGRRASVLVDPDDSAVFVARELALILLAIGFGMMLRSGERIDQSETR